jgi:hypothetical protein
VKSILNQDYPNLTSFKLLIWASQDNIWEKALIKKIGNDSIKKRRILDKKGVFLI